MNSTDLHRRSSFVLAVIGFGLAASAVAQSVSAPTPPAVPPSSDELIELSPFVVDDSRDVGYLAANTLAGSRLNTALKDTPASISVLTQEFLSDIGAFQLTDALNYGVNIEFDRDDDRESVNGNATFQSYQTYRIRGLSATVSRNYFPWFGRAVPDEMAFTERIEDSRGPNAVLFGIGSPGGVINVNTKQALTGRAFQKGTFSVGSYDSKRGALDFNQPALGGKLAFRVNLVYNKNNEFRHWQFQDHRRGLLSAAYHLTKRTRIRAEFERGQLDSNEPRSFTLDNRFLTWDRRGRPTFANLPTVPDATVRAANGLSQLATAANTPRVTYISNDNSAISMRGTLITTGDVPTGEQTAGGGVIGSGVITDTRIADYSINMGGPAQTRSSRYGMLTAFLEHQIAKGTFLEFAFNHVEQSFDNRDPRQDSANGLKGDPNRQLLSGAANPFAGQVYLETNWFRTVRYDQADMGRGTLSTEFDAKKWGNYRIAALGEYEKSYFSTTTYREFWVDSATGLPAFNTATPENAQNNVWRRSYPIEHDWATYYVSGPYRSGGLLSNVRDPVTGRTLSSAWLRQQVPSGNFSTRKSGMVVAQARYFANRLIVAAGLRRDELDQRTMRTWRDPATNLQSLAFHLSPESNTNTGRTKTFGLVYHVMPKVSLYYNRADNVALPNFGAQMLNPNGEPGNLPLVPAPKGEGEDLGLGLSLLNDRIYAKLTYYETAGRQQATTSPALVRTINTRIMDALLAAGLVSQLERDQRTNVGSQGLFDHASKGWEVQVTANPTRNWRIQANYALADAVEENKFTEWLNWEKLTTPYLSRFDQGLLTASGNTLREEILTYQGELRAQTEAVGLGKLGNRRHKVSLVTRYTVNSGRLKGAYVGGTYRHQSKMFTGLDPNGNVVYANSFWRSDLLAGYAVQGLRKGRQLIFQFHVFNVFNERDPLITRYSDDGSVFRNVVQPPTTWRFTTNFEY